MKYLFTALLTILSYTICTATEHINENRWTKHNLSLQECDYSGNNISDTLVPVPKRSKFQIVGQTTEWYIINFWDWDEENSNYSHLNYNARGNSKYFKVNKNSLDDQTDIIYKKCSPTGGTITFPFKYHPETGEFEKTFSLSLIGGLKYLMDRTNNEHSISFMLGIGASSVTLTKFNTSPNSMITENTDRTAVTMSLNILYQWKNLQIGLTSGIDDKLDGNREGYMYQGKPWYSIAIGVNVFSANEIKNPGQQ